MSEWKEYKLGEAIEFGNGKVRPFSTGEIPVYGGNGILDFCNEWNYENETIIIGRVGAYCGSVYYENRPIWISDNALAAKSKNNFNTKFLFYFLYNMGLNQFAEGSSHPLVTQTLLNSIDVFITDDIPEQRAIASILSSLDDKIDLLHRQNKTLEALAETLFRQWFVEEADESWERTQIGKVLKTELGGTPSTEHAEYWDGDIPWINSGEINKFRIVDATKFITRLGLEKSNTKLMAKGTTVLAITGATLGQISLLEIDTCANQSVVGIIPNDRIPKEYVFLWVKYKIDDIILNETGGAQPHINKNDVNETMIILPPDDLLKEKNIILNYYFEKITLNTFQIRTLTQLRDTLLPKLMSGEVRVEY